MMKIVEIFESIQGEGFWIGRPCTFVRLQGCNLSCDFCDTSFNDGEEMAVEAVCKRILQGKQDFVVFTGGEPCLQRSAITELCSLLRAEGYEGSIAIETNGTLPVPEGISWITISPKKDADYKIEYSMAHEMKFVVTKDFQIGDIARILCWYHGMIWLQPDSNNMQENWQRCYEIAMSDPFNRFRVGVQLHKLMEVR